MLFNQRLVGIKVFIHFLRGISPKVNVIACLDFEITYSEAEIQNISHYAVGTSSK